MDMKQILKCPTCLHGYFQGEIHRCGISRLLVPQTRPVGERMDLEDDVQFGWERVDARADVSFYCNHCDTIATRKENSGYSFLFCSLKCMYTWRKGKKDTEFKNLTPKLV